MVWWLVGERLLKQRTFLFSLYNSVSQWIYLLRLELNGEVSWLTGFIINDFYDELSGLQIAATFSEQAIFLTTGT